MDSNRLSNWLSLAGNVGLMIGLLFVAKEINQNTKQLRRAEMNATHEQISVWRHAIIENQDLAEIYETGSRAPESLTPPQLLRLDLTLAELFWTQWQFWDRARVGAIEGEWERLAIAGPRYSIQSNRAAREWWEQNRVLFDAAFVRAVEKQGE